MERIAECCCGYARIKVKDEPVISGICHCDNCKKRTGSAFGLSTYFSKIHTTILSDLTPYHVDAETGKQTRYFCPTCGTTLYWTTAMMPNHIGIAGGCFTQTPLETPTFISAKDNQCAWLHYLPNINKPLTAEDIPT